MRHLLCALLLVATPAAADPPGLSTRFTMDADQFAGMVEGQAGPVFGGVGGATSRRAPRPDALAVYVGFRPRARHTRMELRLAQPVEGDAALTFDARRPLGRRASLSTRVAVQAETAATSALATLALTRRTRLAAELGGAHDGAGNSARVRLSLSRDISRGGALDMALTEASDQTARAALGLRLAF